MQTLHLIALCLAVAAAAPAPDLSDDMDKSSLYEDEAFKKLAFETYDWSEEEQPGTGYDDHAVKGEFSFHGGSKGAKWIIRYIADKEGYRIVEVLGLLSSSFSPLVTATLLG